MKNMPTYEELEQRVRCLENESKDRKRTEDKLRLQAQIIDQVHDAIISIDLDGRVTSWNKGAEKLFGFSVQYALAKDILFLYPRRSGEFVQSQVIRPTYEKGGHAFDVRMRKPTGEDFYVHFSLSLLLGAAGEPIGIIGYAIDITERKCSEKQRKKLEAKLRYAQRMEAIGTLASGIAHDFNNLLMGIQGNVSLMLISNDPPHPDCERLQKIEKQVQNGVKLTKQLLGYARRECYQVRPCNLNDIVQDTSETFGRTRKEVTIHRELAPDLCSIDADQGEIERALFNLYVNAADAMPGGGNLILKTLNTTHQNMKAWLYDPSPGDYILLTLKDTGVGMDRGTIARIFDPFFTTKERGHGTGLGLAVTYAIIKAHKGYIEVESKKGQGATFRIFLPSSKKAAPKLRNTEEKVVMRGTGTVLLVDDEEIIRTVGKELLEAIGYKVITAVNGQEALRLYQTYYNDIKIILLDMVMPGMSGSELYDAIKAFSPDAKVLLSSGYSLTGQALEMVKRGCDGFIQKPFSMAELSNKLNEILMA
ncbi:MAG: response regulator [Pseudomonadota bacterium]